MEKKVTTQNSPAARPGIKIPKPKKKRRWLAVLIVLVVLAAVLWAFVLRPIMDSAGRMNDLLYNRHTVEYRNITVVVSGTAVAQPRDTAQITASVQSKVTEAPFAEGDVVTAGEVLFRFDTKSVENSIRRSEISVEQQRISYQNQLDNRSDAEKNRDIKSTASGVVTKVYVEAGDTVTMNTPIADVVDRENIKLVVPFHSADARGFSVGADAQVQVGSETLSGKVDAIAAVDKAGTGGTLVREVTILLRNPGALSAATSATASVGDVDCAAAGSFREPATTAVTAKTSGTIEKLYVSEGDKVTKDKVIGRLEGSGSDSQLENARLSLESAELSLQSSYDQLENYTVTAPISGVVMAKNVEVGDSPAGVLAVIYDLSALTFEMKVDELYINQIEVGQQVTLTADALEGQVFTGRVSKVSHMGSTMSGVTTYPVTVELEETGALLPGMNASADIIVAQVEHVLAVPTEALRRGNVVWVLPPDAVNSDGSPDYSRLEERQVTLGSNDDNYIEILSGVSEGETVVSQVEYSSLMEQMMAMSGRR